MIVYCTGHEHSEIVCRPAAEGFGWDLVGRPWPRPLKGPAAFYGRGRGTLDIMRQCQADGTDWYMIDNGYIGARRFDGYYKITRNAYQTDGRDPPDWERWGKLIDDLGIVIRPWRKARPDGHVLVCPPIIEYDECHWFSTPLWSREVRRRARKISGGRREIRVRFKPLDPRATYDRPLEDDLKGCHAVITHDSNVVVEAIIAGIPAFVTGDSPAQVLGNVDLAALESPRLADNREEWLAGLAGRQWTLDEIRAGMANEALGIKQ